MGPDRLSLRPLQRDDVERFPGRAAALDVYLDDQDRGTRWVRVAEHDGEVAGYVTLLWEADDTGLRVAGIPEISDLFVRDEVRRRGIGSALLDAAEAKAAHRADAVGLTVGLHSGYGAAQRIYVRRGYVPDGQGVVVEGETVPEGASIVLNDDPIVALRLVKRLGPQDAAERPPTPTPDSTSDPLPTLETERLVLRPFTVEDAPDVQTLAGDRRIAATTLTVPHPYEDGMAEAWIGTHESRWRSREALILAIEEPTSGLVGAIGLTLRASDPGVGELGYWVGVPHWGNGYATEAARTMVAHGFDSLGLRRVEAQHLLGNPASGRVMEKVGMVKEGEHRQAVLKWGVAEDVAWYAVVRRS